MLPRYWKLIFQNGNKSPFLLSRLSSSSSSLVARNRQIILFRSMWCTKGNCEIIKCEIMAARVRNCHAMMFETRITIAKQTDNDESLSYRAFIGNSERNFRLTHSLVEFAYHSPSIANNSSCDIWRKGTHIASCRRPRGRVYGIRRGDEEEHEMCHWACSSLICSAHRYIVVVVCTWCKHRMISLSSGHTSPAATSFNYKWFLLPSRSHVISCFWLHERIAIVYPLG